MTRADDDRCALAGGTDLRGGFEDRSMCVYIVVMGMPRIPVLFLAGIVLYGVGYRTGVQIQMYGYV